uniref:Peptidase M12B domain-containing protein n=1 Tax=Globodera pallida TaxID=36090 RepID=A0A183C042_GLOPA
MSLLILLALCPFCATLNEIALNRCELKLVADYEFFRVIGNGNYANAARYLINMIERVNGIFGSVDWGLDITGHRLVNIGFAIKEIKILDKPNFSSSTHFNAALRPIDGVNSMEMLDSFSAEEGTNATCLCLLVTAKVLSSGVLGLANIGYQNEYFKRGICAREIENGTFHRNTALFSVRRRHELMITRVVDLVAAHELGHAFGSTHDDVHDADCVPQPSRDGRYMMWESANTGYERNHYQFSPCSVRAIHRVLYSLAHRCFVEERRALCGNGILEAGEQCDCGAQIGGTGPAGEGDRCCTADCRLKPSALCSPRHSECCTNNCTFMERGRLCQGRSEEMCKDESRCSGISDKCPPPNPLADGTVCPDEGKCRAGECISFCASLAADLSPCLCEGDENACRRCCRSRQHIGSGSGGAADGGHCAPVRPFRWLPEGSMCVHGQCQRGETTTGGGGQKTMMCEKKATDSASFFHRLLDNFKGPAPRKYIF